MYLTPLRDMIARLPLERIMIETDAPYMGFKKGRRSCEPVDVVDVAKRLSEVYGLAHSTWRCLRNDYKYSNFLLQF